MGGLIFSMAKIVVLSFKLKFTSFLSDCLAFANSHYFNVNVCQQKIFTLNLRELVERVIAVSEVLPCESSFPPAFGEFPVLTLQVPIVRYHCFIKHTGCGNKEND